MHRTVTFIFCALVLSASDAWASDVASKIIADNLLVRVADKPPVRTLCGPISNRVYFRDMVPRGLGIKQIILKRDRDEVSAWKIAVWDEDRYYYQEWDPFWMPNNKDTKIKIRVLRNELRDGIPGKRIGFYLERYWLHEGGTYEFQRGKFEYNSNDLRSASRLYFHHFSYCTDPDPNTTVEFRFTNSEEEPD
ncbi:hypothetical protein [Methylobacterium sp. ID0610]|uniref:hypothetical protein n=1 Tax=Methylobacterium carpenticola TaxID=3344827 RepID=UPI003697D895